MRPVARIAQSVEQGIENPRVLGSIPSPGTTYSENPAYGWVFAFLRADSPSNSVRLFAARRLTPSGPARPARCSTPAALVRARAPLFKEPAHKAVFCFWGASTSFPSKSPPPPLPEKIHYQGFCLPHALSHQLPERRSACFAGKALSPASLKK